MANNQIVRFVLDDEVVEQIGQVNETEAYELMSVACEWYIEHKTPMTMDDYRCRQAA